MKNLLRKLFQPLSFPQLKTPQNYTLPWGMSHSDWVALQRLVISEDFQVLQKTLDNVINSYAEHLLVSEKMETIHFLRGKIQGIRYALEIVDEIHKKEKDFLTHERRRTDAGTVGPNRITGATYGTPAWRNNGTV